MQALGLVGSVAQHCCQEHSCSQSLCFVIVGVDFILRILGGLTSAVSGIAS